ncbi:hypothetical protein LFT48_16370 [Arthrobacter sp. FW305-123]|nr:hypothetical protein LFT48_16370 [Arthrobacter sp. FW305-123]
MSRTATSIVLSVALVTVASGCVEQAARTPEPLSFGVLGGTCSAGNLAALHDAGVSVVELPLAWDRYQPKQQHVDRSYVASIRSQLKRCREAGMAVVLSLGVHYPPDWVRGLPGGMLKGSKGGIPANSGAELVFSADVRNAAKKYMALVAADLGFQGVSAIRAGTNDVGELGYPGPEDGGNRHEYWAFGDAPQLGIGLAEGMAASPMPGWVPGSGSWDGQLVTEEQVQQWWAWYSGSVVDATKWQIGELRKLGYQGRVHVPVAGRGVLPADIEKAIKGHLDGRSNPDGAQERGLDYSAQFPSLAALPGVDVDFTGLDDVSAVRAAALVPKQDRCLPADEEKVLEKNVYAWSSQRYTSALARRAGLGLVGENPGPPGSPFTGGSSQSHSLAEQLRAAPGYAAECGMTMFLLGFEENLFEGHGGDESAVELADYKDVIQQMRSR